jgi:hypothetical protein
MSARRKRPRGFYARLARDRGVSFTAIYRKFNPDKRPCAREKLECDASRPWRPGELVRMDRAFCEAMEREIARGSERPRPFATQPAACAIRPARPASRRSGATFPAKRRRDIGERDRSC